MTVPAKDGCKGAGRNSPDVRYVFTRLRTFAIIRISTHSSIPERNKGLHEVLKAARYWSPSYKTMEASINCQRRNSNQNRKGLCYRVLRAVLSVTPLSQAARDTCFVKCNILLTGASIQSESFTLRGSGSEQRCLASVASQFGVFTRWRFTLSVSRLTSQFTLLVARPFYKCLQSFPFSSVCALECTDNAGRGWILTILEG